MNKIISVLLSSVATTLVASNNVQALSFVENNAGDSLATAQIIPNTGVNGSITPTSINILGTFDSPSDVDLYQLFLTGGQTFSAQVLQTGTSVIDTRLYLFDSTGQGIYANDDIDANNGDLLSRLPNGALSPATSGLYYLAATTTDNDALNTVNNLIFNLSPGGNSSAVVAPSSTPTILNSWSGTTGEVGTYNIRLIGVRVAAPATVSESQPLSLFASLSLLGLGLSLKSQKKSNNS